ncbi:MAG: acetyl-CoA carboxylase biotin carboxyl carrier protein [Alphaproteobacteria bacterium]
MTEFDIDRRLLDKLTKTFKDAELTDLEFRNGETHIILSKRPPKVMAQAAAGPAVQMMPANAPVAAPATAEAPVAVDPANDKNAVVSPMVGTAYLAPEPSKPNFISVGDKVSAGQTLLIIEAMKVMNPLESPRAGTVKAILVNDTDPVEFDQPLVVIE